MTKLIPEAADAIARALKPEKPTVIELMEENARLKASIDEFLTIGALSASQQYKERITNLTARIAELEAALRLPDADRRQWFLSELIAGQGHFNRSDLCEEFRISVPQASADIKRFLTSFPHIAKYDTKAKRYIRRALENSHE